MESRSADIPASALLARISDEVRKYGIEPVHSGWLVKALHPAAAGVTSGGIPDASFFSLVRDELRIRHAIPLIVPGDTGELCDVCIWSVPGDVEVAGYSVGAVGTDFSEPGTQFSWVRAQTTTLVATGRISEVDSAPGLQFCSTEMPATAQTCWRTTHAGMTIEMTAATVADQGTVVASQFCRPVRLVESVVNRTPPSAVQLAAARVRTDPPVPADAVPQWNICATEPLLDEAIIVNSDPRAYQGKAIDGVYLPLRLTGPTQDFQGPVPPRSISYGKANVQPYGSAGSTRAQCNIARYADLRASPLPANWSSMSSGNSAYDNVNQGVVIFRGISKTATLTLKYYLGLEYIPAPDSPVRTFTQNPTPYSPTAIDLYYRLAQEMPSAYPSRFNSLGALAGVIANLIPKVLPVVAPLAMAGVSKLVSMLGGPAPEPARRATIVAPATKRRSTSVASSNRSVASSSKRKRKRA